MHCRKCLTGRTGDVLGGACRTPGCDGIIEDVSFYSLVDKLPELMTCGRRDRGEPNQDWWNKHKSNGDRTCNYCGSLHPEDFFRLVKACAEAPDDVPYGSIAEIEPSDKGYKIYVQRLSVRNAEEGGIKFYTQHLLEKVTPEQDAEYKAAVAKTRARFEAYLAKARSRQ